MSEQKTRKEEMRETIENAKFAQSSAQALINKLEKMTDEEWERWGREHNSDLEFILKEATEKMNASIITVDILRNVRKLTKDPYKG